VQLQLVHPKTFVQLKDIMNDANWTTSDTFKPLRVTANPDAINLLMNRSL
jgi:hypothetical protein